MDPRVPVVEPAEVLAADVITQGGVQGALTDGTGVSKMLTSKVVKDLVLDFLLSAPIAIGAVNIFDLNAAVAAPVVVAIALGDAGIRVFYRAALRWTQT